MNASDKQRILIGEIYEEIETLTRALSAFSDLLCSCNEQHCVNLNDLYYLIDPIVTQQKQLASKLMAQLD